MKQIIIAIMLVFCAAGVHAENMNISTSQYYVDTNAATRQDAAPANNANSVMTYDSTSPDGIGAKAIYDTTATYGEQKSALVTAATANAAIQNGINSEFVCANPPKCNLWDLKGFYPTSLPAGYTELEYISFDGTPTTGAYIDTGLNFNTDIPNTNVRFIADAKVYSGNDWQVIVGNYGYYSAYVGPNGNNILYYGFGVTDTSTSVINPYQRCIFDLDLPKGKYVVTNMETGSTIVNIANIVPVRRYNNAPIYLGGFNDEPAVSVSVMRPARTKMDLYSVKIYNNNALMFNGIPCRRNSDNVVGIYDTVSQTFKTNAAGTNSLTAGPVASYLPQNR